ncbi:MAG: UvrD-helicase domain-containing protein [Candidatus Acidiferrales bacterium]|jgi:DNA helicase-2/ATP-dependent DNA helicase PcrA
MPELEQLNEKQRAAVLATEGPVLVLAGAGTGKTRVITYRAAHLVEMGVDPRSILCVTFTNKAAEQMKQRITDLLRARGLDASEILISTFHSFSARLLRREATRIGLPRDYTIYDDDAQIRAVKLALAELQLDDREYTPRSFRERISRAKNHGVTPGQMAGEAYDAASRAAASVFETYERILRRAGAVDFDDLLLFATRVLREHPDARAEWNKRLRYIQVDEFQDTNAAQEELVRLLAGGDKNICVVGDEDQSIYGWRGARAGNMKRFIEDFPGTQVIRLEKNYRSTQTILDAAAGVVSHNASRLGKTLEAVQSGGQNVRFFEAQDALAEAEFITGEISSFVRNEPDAHVAVLYRTTAQSRALEESLRRVGTRYRVVGGFSFYERAEVRDALAYVRLLFHPEDDVALLRVLNTPPRGIGKTTVETLQNASKTQGASIWDAIQTIAQPGVTRSGAALRGFRYLIETMQAEVRDSEPAEMLRQVLERTGYLAWVEQQDKLEHTSRMENLTELVNAMAEATEAGQTLQDVLDQAALVSAADDYQEDVNVTLMTLHSAKGLEFESVYLAGLEEGLLPHSRSIGSNDDVEEERRLCYVGMTRAKKSLTLSRALFRRNYGEERLRSSAPSRFLREIPGELIETLAGSLAEAGETRRYEPDPDYYQSRPKTAYGGRSIGGRAAGSGRSKSHPLIGTRVRHSVFGMGTIISVEEEDDDRMLTVSFVDHGTKKLKERYANLQLA